MEDPLQFGDELVAAADSAGTVVNRPGPDVEPLVRLKSVGRSVCDCPDGEKLPVDAVVGVECDIWIPAARPSMRSPLSG